MLGTFETKPSDSKWVLVVYLVKGTGARLTSALGLNNSFGVGIRTTTSTASDSEELPTLTSELLVELEDTDGISSVLECEDMQPNPAGTNIR